MIDIKHDDIYLISHKNERDTSKVGEKSQTPI